MPASRPLFSICIPAYNRARFLGPLLDSVLSQDFGDYEILVCEDSSPERAQIASIIESYASGNPAVAFRYVENEKTLGYDGNIRKLIAESAGRYCFFMGNDDIMYPGALRRVADVVLTQPDVGFVLKGYTWFEGDPPRTLGKVRYVTAPRTIDSGAEAVSFCFRRCGVIAGLVVVRDAAHGFATDRFDGTLYYQMYVVGRVLASQKAVVLPDLLVACRADVAPDFGASEKEKKSFVPGKYTPGARLTMLSGLLEIARAVEADGSMPVYQSVVRDYSAHFFPYMADQIGLPMRDYWTYYRQCIRLGFGRTPYFHAYFWLGRLLGRRRFEWCTQKIRDMLGRTVVLR